MLDMQRWLGVRRRRVEGEGKGVNIDEDAAAKTDTRKTSHEFLCQCRRLTQTVNLVEWEYPILLAAFHDET